MLEAIDHYHGLSVVDPYRWMEKHASFSEWLATQDYYSRTVLQIIQGRNELIRRIAELDHGVDTVSSLQRAAGDTYFYFRSVAGATSPKLVMRKGIRGKERILVDPDKAGENGKEGSIFGYFVPSLDGRYVAFGLTAKTSAESVLRVVETSTGRILPDQIDRTHFHLTGLAP